jgi:hypothetical protein
MQTPEWVYPVVQTVALRYGRKHLPTIKWRKSNMIYSSGYYRRWKHTVSICAGRDSSEHKWILLHELAHWLTRGGHTKGFWYTVFDLYDTFGVTALALPRERAYRKKASLIYVSRLGVNQL